MLYVSVVRACDVRRPSPRSPCAAHARMLLAERLAQTHRALRPSVLSRVLCDWQRLGPGERLAAHRILTGLDEYDLEWQCELLVQEATLS
jgi:hypothetical protein